MEIIQLIVIIVVIGVLLWLVNTYVPMDENIKKILNAVVIIALVIWLLFWVLAVLGVGMHTRLIPP